MTLNPGRAALVVVILAGLFAVAAARPYAGGWNDGSRLAAVESLLSRGTLAIEGSPFTEPRGLSPAPYGPTQGMEDGTRDKLLIAGRYYSDKPAVIAVLMAASYRAGMLFGLPDPHERPDWLAWTLTILFSGGAAVAALLALWRVGRLVGLEGWSLPAWLASAAFATCVLAYAGHVNNHILQLAIVAAVCALALDAPNSWRLVGLGTLAGLGFNLDLGSGPLLVLACLVLAWLPRRSFTDLFLVGLAALPWVAAGLAVNFAIGGVLKPMNMVPEYSQWPGGPFDRSNLTGFWRHTPLGYALYAGGMLFGKKGLVPHDPALWMALPALAVLTRPHPHRAALAVLLAWCGAAWMLYAALSNNGSGACVSVRWFVPFLAPAYLLLALHLRQRPEALPGFLALSAAGTALGLIMWRIGPWTLRMVPFLWPINAIALAGWAIAYQRRPAPDAALPLRRAA